MRVVKRATRIIGRPFIGLITTTSLLHVAMAVGLLVFPSVAPSPAEGAQIEQPPWDICFVPGERRCTQVVVNALDAAKMTVLVQAYSFTSPQIAQALVRAHQRGVKVEVILDKSQLTEQASCADLLTHASIPTMIDAHHRRGIAHNKVMIIDGETVITGSFNFSRRAEENNAENVLLVSDKAMAARYTKNWHDHALHSDPYAGRASNDEKLCARPSKKAKAKKP